MNLTDTHCHLDLDRFDPDRGEVLSRAWETGLTRILIPGLDLLSSKRVVELARGQNGVFAAIGVHPNEALSWNSRTYADLKQLYADVVGEAPNPVFSQKIVAVGEIGLDYYWNAAPHTVQHSILKEQLALAAELKLPVILHLREQSDALDGPCTCDLLEILQEWVKTLHTKNSALANSPGVLHSFSGNLKTALQILDLNFYIGITGPVTYKNAVARREVVKSLPLERLLIETDAPFLAPVPRRGLRNEPAFVRHIADKIAEIHNKDPEEIAALTSANAARLFSWGG